MIHNVMSRDLYSAMIMPVVKYRLVGQVVSVLAVLAGAIVMYQTREDVLHTK